MPKQTSFDLLYNYLLSEHYDKLPMKVIFEIALKAKQMHKEEIVDGYANGHNDGCRYMDNLKQDFEHGEQYYQETYGGQDA